MLRATVKISKIQGSFDETWWVDVGGASIIRGKEDAKQAPVVGLSLFCGGKMGQGGCVLFGRLNFLSHVMV